jgi:hypothetical protein
MLLANPLHSAETNWLEEPKDALLPQLRRASDLIFAYSLRNNPDPKNLKYYIANNVQNAQTLPVIASILKNKGLTAAPEWPGVTLSAWEGNEVEALLGITFHIGPKNHHSCLHTNSMPRRIAHRRDAGPYVGTAQARTRAQTCRAGVSVQRPEKGDGQGCSGASACA